MNIHILFYIVHHILVIYAIELLYISYIYNICKCIEKHSNILFMV